MLLYIREYTTELLLLLWRWANKSKANKALFAAGILVCVFYLGMLLLRLLSPAADADPFSYQPVYGEVLYEDGGTIPSSQLELTFLPQTGSRGPYMHPRAGHALVDVKTGHFESATTCRSGDGIVRGVHKVLLTGANRSSLPSDLVAPEYADHTRTPLSVDTANGRSVSLRIKRPVSKPVE
jgi:hypothetical protein